MKDNYFAQENEHTRKHFDLESVLAFQLEHDVQIIRGEDWQYHCHIDKKIFAISLTPMGALVVGIERFKERNTEIKPDELRYANAYKDLKAFLQAKKSSKRLCAWDDVHYQEIWDKMIEFEKKYSK